MSVDDYLVKSPAFQMERRDNKEEDEKVEEGETVPVHVPVFQLLFQFVIQW